MTIFTAIPRTLPDAALKHHRNVVATHRAVIAPTRKRGA
jgi:hypothetical protein